MLKSKINWFVLWFASSLVLIWRLVDFADEAVNDGFHMTRGGLAVFGPDAGIIQLLIILASIALVWKASASLVRLHLSFIERT